MEELTAEAKAEIDGMSRIELARKWRFSPVGDPFWQGARGMYAHMRFFGELGGFTPEISKEIGWDT